MQPAAEQKPSEGLGDCAKCHGPMCVIGPKVCCERCGHIHENHPLTQDAAPTKAAPTRNIPAMDYPATVPDRVNTLERRVAFLERHLVAATTPPSVPPATKPAKR